MSPATHLLASWMIDARTCDNQRDVRLVTLAGVLPDLDGLGYAADIVNHWLHRPDFELYQKYHHIWTHGLPAAVVFAAVFAYFAKQRKKVFFLSLITFHLHLLCDLGDALGIS